MIKKAADGEQIRIAGLSCSVYQHLKRFFAAVQNTLRFAVIVQQPVGQLPWGHNLV